jgi:hypothetical protein
MLMGALTEGCTHGPVEWTRMDDHCESQLGSLLGLTSTLGSDLSVSTGAGGDHFTRTRI